MHTACLCPHVHMDPEITCSFKCPIPPHTQAPEADLTSTLQKMYNKLDRERGK